MARTAVNTPIDADAFDPAPVDRSDRVTLVIHEAHDAANNIPVFVGVNGTGYLIKRGERVNVPRAVAGVLNNAIEHRYDYVKDDAVLGGKRLVKRAVPAYPFSVVG